MIDSRQAGAMIFHFCKKHAQTILAIGATVGVVLTSVEASKATLKAERVIENKKKDREEWAKTSNIPQPAITKEEIIRDCWSLYVPTALYGVATISCIVASTVIGAKRQKELLAAYAMIDQSYKAYRKKVSDEYGEEVDRKIANEIIEETEKDDYEQDKLLFYDMYSERYFESTMRKVQEATTYVNRELMINGFASLNDLYRTIGICETEDGAIMGWSLEGVEEMLSIPWLDFDIRPNNLGDGTICYTVQPVINPTFSYLGE